MTGHHSGAHMYPCTLPVPICARAPFLCSFVPRHHSVDHMCLGTIQVRIYMCLGTIPMPICSPGTIPVPICAQVPFQ